MSGEMEVLGTVEELTAEPPGEQDTEPEPTLKFTTGIRFDEINFQLRIENFHVASLKPETMQGESTIQVGGSVGIPTEWRIRITTLPETINFPVPSGADGGVVNTTTAVEWLGFCAILEKVPDEDMEICSSMAGTIYDKNGIRFYHRRLIPYYFRLNTGRHYKKMVPISNVTRAHLPLMADNSLRIDINLKIYATRPTLSCSLSEQQFKKKSSDKLSTDMAKLLKGAKPETADIKLISKDGQEFYAHKLILATRNHYFMEKIESNQNPNRVMEIPMNDVNGKVLGLLLEYIYCGFPKDGGAQWFDPENIVEFVKGAVLCDLFEVQEYLNQVLGEKGKGQHAGALLAVVEESGMVKAEKELMNYIKTVSVPQATNYAQLCSIFPDVEDIFDVDVNQY